ncbi:MAG: SDR family NAD(P)-dependent oxidoreductase, partial [Acidobacteriaceae bacterium]
MKIGRTLLVLGTIAGVGCLELYAARRRRTANRSMFVHDIRKGSSGLTRYASKNSTLSHTVRLALQLREFSPWGFLQALAVPTLTVARRRSRGRNKNADSSLAGKVVVITGGSRGLGLALAEEFARNGAKLVLAARDADELTRACTQLLKLGTGLREQDIETIPCDLTDSEQAAKMIAFATGRFGQIDILVNNAGIISVGPLEDQPEEAFKRAIGSNYYTMLHSTLAALPQMLERQNGSIVNITSIGGKLAVPHMLPYSASKFAALGFSQGLHAELRGKGIRVTTVCPGLMRTGSHTQALFTGDREREYRWFSLSASLPWVSTSARAAARKIVRAAAEGRTEITITPQALLAATFAQALPEWTAML